MREKRSRTRWRAAAPAAALLVLAVGLFAAPVPARGLDGSFSGSYKSYLSWIHDLRHRGRSTGTASGVLRLNGALYPAEWLDLELAYLLYPQIRSASLTDSEAELVVGASDYRVADLERRLLPRTDDSADNIGLYHEIDRLALTFRPPFADLVVGRQAIAWGSAHVVNPTDVIVPYRFLDLNTEYRKGVDAARLRVPFGMMNEVDAGYVAGEDFAFDRSAAFARTRLYLLETDISILGMVFRENLMAGLDLARAIGEAGAWLEAAYVVPDLVSTGEGPVSEPLDADYLGVSVGADYNFTGSFYGYAEYHFNSAGTGDPGRYLDVYLFPREHPAYSEGNVYLLGRHYLSVGGTYTVTPLLPVSALIMLNLGDLSVDLSLSAEYNVKENVYITGGFYVGIGEGPDTAAGSVVRYNSEFGAYPDVFYTSVKIYF